MDPDELEDLLRELVQAIGQVVESGEDLSDEFQGLLAQTLSTLVDRIDEARQAQPQDAQIQQAPSSEAQLLWVLSGQQEQAFISYLRNFPSAETNALLKNPQQLSNTIDQLTQLIPPGKQPVVDGIQHSDLNSSNIWGAAYDPKTQTLLVRFQGGSEYEYDGVPQNIFRAFIKGNAAAKTTGRNRYGRWWRGKVPSIGSALHQYIRQGGFPYRKVK